MRGLVLLQVVLAISTAVVCQDVTPEYPERGLEDEPIEEDQELPTEPREETAQVPAAAPAVSVQPLTVPAASYVPAGVPPSGVIFSNGPAGNVQSFQVPGAGMALGEGKKIPFILINNVAAGAAGGTAPAASSEQQEMDRLCANTMGPGFVYSAARHLCEPSAAAAASYGAGQPPMAEGAESQPHTEGEEAFEAPLEEIPPQE